MHGGHYTVKWMFLLITLSFVSCFLAVETGAIVVDWLALITMAVFLLHRVKYTAREYIRPRSLIAFGILTFVSGGESPRYTIGNMVADCT